MPNGILQSGKLDEKIEQVDDDYLDRHGLAPDGSLYKVVGSPVPGPTAEGPVLLEVTNG